VSTGGTTKTTIVVCRTTTTRRTTHTTVLVRVSRLRPGPITLSVFGLCVTEVTVLVSCRRPALRWPARAVGGCVSSEGARRSPGGRRRSVAGARPAAAVVAGPGTRGPGFVTVRSAANKRKH